MKGLLIFTLGAFLAFQGPTPEHPWPNHQQPDEGWFCHPGWDAKDVQSNAHACDCRGMVGIDQDPDPAPHCKRQPILDEEGNPTGETYLPENNARCKVACHPTHCHCSKRCTDT